MVLITPFIKLFHGIIQTSVFGKEWLSHRVPKTDKAWPTQTGLDIAQESCSPIRAHKLSLCVLRGSELCTSTPFSLGLSSLGGFCVSSEEISPASRKLHQSYDPPLPWLPTSAPHQSDSVIWNNSPGTVGAFQPLRQSPEGTRGSRWALPHTE